MKVLFYDQVFIPNLLEFSRFRPHLNSIVSSSSRECSSMQHLVVILSTDEHLENVRWLYSLPCMDVL